MKKILLIDDDMDIHNVVRHALTDQFDLESVYDLKTAELKLGKEEFDLIILDEMLPDGRGTDFCFKVKKDLGKEHLPLIMLTQRRDLVDKLTAFNSGADDYVIKPFEPLELLARINARLRIQGSSESNSFVKGDLEFDLTTQGLILNRGEEATTIVLTPIEFKILYLMAKKEGQVFSRDAILEAIWGNDKHVVDRTVDQHISKVRKRSKDSQYTVKASHGLGYAFLKDS